MTVTRLLRAAAAAALLAAPQTGWTVFDPVNDDTDIFLANPSFNATRPNVLIFLDNTANWAQSTGGAPPMDTKFGAVTQAIKNVLTNVVTDNFNVGLALFVETGSPNNNTDGAYLRYGVRQMTAANKNVLTNVLTSLDINGDKGNGAVYSLASAELFKYFAGTTSLSGHAKLKADAGDTVYFSTGRVALTGSPLALGALPASGGTAQTYVSPIIDSCQKNFIVFVSNGEANDNSSALSTAQGLLSSIVGTSPPATIAISPSGEQGLWSDEYAKYMANGDCNTSFPGAQNVLTYTIDVMPKSTGQGPDHTAMLKSAALNGKGHYFPITNATDTGELENAFKSIFAEVQSVNSVFASTTLPVSVNVRGTNLNQVYIGVFRPDANKSPRWFGNLKLYKLGVDTATQNLFLADAIGAPAENASTGFISTNATSYWTQPTCFWQFRGADPTSTATTPTSCSVSTIATDYPYWSDSPDGNSVEKGGSAEQLRAKFPTSNAARNVWSCGKSGAGFCAPGDLLSATPFVAANVDPADVNAYITYSIASLNWDVVTKIATMTLTTSPSPAWATGNTVRISGVTPIVFNGDFVVTKDAVNPLVYTFTLNPGPNATRGRIHAVNHQMQTGDIVMVFAGCQPQAVFATWDVDASCIYDATSNPPWKTVTRRDADNFDYDLQGPASTTLTTGQFFPYGGRQIAFARGRTNPAVQPTTVLYTIPGHGFGPNGSSVNGPNFTVINSKYEFQPPWSSVGWWWEWYSTATWYGPITVVDADTISAAPNTNYVYPGFNGASNNFVQLNVFNHPYATGNTVTVTGASAGATAVYNGTKTITRFDANSIGFPSTVGADDALNVNVRVGAVITSITRPTTSGGPSNCSGQSVRDTATVTTATPHYLKADGTFRVNIYGTGGAGPLVAYDGSWVVQSIVNATQFTIIDNCFDTGASPTNLNPAPAGALAGFPAGGTALLPGGTDAIWAMALTSQAVTSPGAPEPIYVQRYLVNADLDRPLSSGAGAMTAGRPVDISLPDRDLIVAWARSTDNKDNENIDCTVSPFYPCGGAAGTTPRMTDARSSVHGDVLHSRPATINYNRLQLLYPGTDADSMLIKDSDIYAFYGSNDGLLHAVKGGVLQKKSSTTPPTTIAVPPSTITGGLPNGPDVGVAPGTERWAFLPQEFWPKLKRLREQFPPIDNLNQKDYFFDGSIGVYQRDAPGSRDYSAPSSTASAACVKPSDPGCGVLGDNIHATSGDKVQLYLTNRRGGNFMYALDVLNPVAPKLLWRKSFKDSGWSILGQTWSEPKIAHSAANLANSANPDNVVVIFGAGYDDTAEDINPCLIAEWYTDNVVPKATGGIGSVTYTATGSCVITGGPGGNAPAVFRQSGGGIMVVDAMTGDMVWQASAKPDGGAKFALTVPQMTCAIASDITVLDKDRNGTADRLYVGDTCGQVWRADISDPDPKNWSVTMIAALANASGDPRTISDKIKFLFPPDLVFAQDASGNYFAVLLGSGDREHPFDTTVQNAFFMIKDRDNSKPSAALEGAPNNTTVSLANPSPDSSLADPLIQRQLFDASGSVVDNSTAESLNGWFIALAPGEKAVGSAVTIAGTTFFNTNQPSSTAGGGACGSNLGIAREYLVGFADAAATVDLNGLGTLSLANRSTIHAGGGYLPSPVPVVVEIDGKKYQAVISGTSVQTPPGLTLEKRTRAFWYKQID